MAIYTAAVRTNYFRVTDEERYAELFAGLLGEDDIGDFTKTENGVTRHAFGSYGTIDWYDLDDENNNDPNFDYFLDELQKILPKDEAFMYFEAGHKNLRYVIGRVILMTSEELKSISLDEWALDTAKELLGEGFTTQIDY